MKELLLQYAQYNMWANKRMIDAMLKLAEGMETNEITSSFPTLQDTVYHTLSAEFIWLQRLQLAERPKWIQDEMAGAFADGCNEWQKISGELIKFVEKQYDDKALEHVCQFPDRAGTIYKMPVFQILHHVFNHSTYHRGQMVTILRQLGVTEIPGTDFVTYIRKK